MGSENLWKYRRPPLVFPRRSLALRTHSARQLIQGHVACLDRWKRLLLPCGTGYIFYETAWATLMKLTVCPRQVRA